MAAKKFYHLAVLSILEPLFRFDKLSQVLHKSFLSLFLRYLKLYANEADCKQWR